MMKQMVRWVMVVALATVSGVMSAASCWSPITSGDTPETLQTHACLGLCLGVRDGQADAVVYKGLTLGVMHASMPFNDVLRVAKNEACNFTGASVQLLSQTNVGYVRGASVTGLLSFHERVDGLQFALLSNDVKRVRGVQAAIGMNVAEEVRGLQVGIFNATKQLRGIQIGIWNTNSSGWTLPLINFNW
jgi:hypothetical protein